MPRCARSEVSELIIALSMRRILFSVSSAATISAARTGRTLCLRSPSTELSVARVVLDMTASPGLTSCCGTTSTMAGTLSAGSAVWKGLVEWGLEVFLFNYGSFLSGQLFSLERDNELVSHLLRS